MQNRIALENIEELRVQAGIDDVELKSEIRALRVGDLVALTFLSGRASFKALVRITSIRGSAFHGELAQQPAVRIPELPIGLAIDFSRDHIHSIPGKQPAFAD